MFIKGFDKDLCCRGMQYEVGNDYKKDNENKKLALCSDTGYHFCKNLRQVHNYYSCDDKKYNRFCEIEVLGEVVEDEDKCITDHIRIVREIVGKELDALKGRVNGNSGLFNSGNWNSGDRNSGNWNSGDRNSGNRNSGDYNSGNWNSGDRNSGNRNSGDYNSGNRNSGNWNSGNRNTGDCNTGDCNTGNYNTGGRNTGDYNTGGRNTGDWNTGYWNTGDWNTGNRNTGYYNTGNRNTGDWNTGDWNTGCFNTVERRIYLFDKPSKWNITDWRYSRAKQLLNQIPHDLVEWISKEDMTKEEKEENPTYKTTGGYLKMLDESESAQIWWDGLSQQDKNTIINIPNFDGEKFEKCVGIKIE